jgi:hypothetical protein
MMGDAQDSDFYWQARICDAVVLPHRTSNPPRARSSEVSAVLGGFATTLCVVFSQSHNMLGACTYLVNCEWARLSQRACCEAVCSSAGAIWDWLATHCCSELSVFDK